MNVKRNCLAIAVLLIFAVNIGCSQFDTAQQGQYSESSSLADLFGSDSNQITPAAAPPYALESFNVEAGKAYSGTFVIGDISQFDVRFAMVRAPSKGQLNITDTKLGKFTYSANANSSGMDSFQIRATLGRQSATITIAANITSKNAPAPQPPAPMPPAPAPAPMPPAPAPMPPAPVGKYRGIPDASAALGFDIDGKYPVTQTITGNQGTVNLSCTGTAAKPCVIDATNATFTKLGLSGSYVILQGGKVNAGSGNGPWAGTTCNRCVIRDVEVAGPGVDSGHSSAVRMGSLSVWLRGKVHGFGDNRPNAREQDYHGFKVIGVSDVWILDAEIYDNSGDSVQVGDASRGSATRVYLGGGYYHDNRENAVDVKDSNDIVVSGIIMEGFRPTASSEGAAMVIHDDAVNSKVYDNVIRDSTIGFVSSGLSGHIVDGNDIVGINVGIQIRNTRNITVQNNKVVAPLRIQVQSGVTGNIQQ